MPRGPHSSLTLRYCGYGRSDWPTVRVDCVVKAGNGAPYPADARSGGRNVLEQQVAQREIAGVQRVLLESEPPRIRWVEWLPT